MYRFRKKLYTCDDCHEKTGFITLIGKKHLCGKCAVKKEQQEDEVIF